MALVTIELLDSWPFGHRIDKLSSSAPGQSLPKWDIRATSVFGLLGRRILTGSQFGAALPDHERRTLDGKGSHDRRHNNIGPSGAGPEHAERCQQNR